MDRVLLISIRPEDRRVAVLEDGRLVEFHWEFRGRARKVGSLFKGRVQRQVTGGGVFVDIGLDRPGYLDSRDMIQQCRPGELVMVQLRDEGGEGKGPKLSQRIAIEGRNLIMEPFSGRIGVSRRLQSGSERARLKEAVESGISMGTGFIVRSAAQGSPREDIMREVGALEGLWAKILKDFQDRGGPGLVWEVPDVAIRVVRDLAVKGTKVFVDSEEEYDRVLRFLDSWVGLESLTVKPYKEGRPLLAYWRVVGELENLASPVVPLKSGGNIVIEHTEALTAIDVNSGAFEGMDRTGRLIQTNLEAVQEVARQLRLRNITGNVVIDLINVEGGLDSAYEELRRLTAKDRSRVKVLPPSELGMIELSRQRPNTGGEVPVLDLCHLCGSKSPRLTSIFAASLLLDRAFDAAYLRGGQGKLRLTGNKDIIQSLVGLFSESLHRLEGSVGGGIVLDERREAGFEVRWEDGP